jgi:frataxin
MGCPFFEKVRASLDDLCHDLENAGVDVDLSPLTLTFPVPGETLPYLVKVHMSSEEIWLSSPLSGGLRFAWHEGQQAWVNTRTSETLYDRLRKELGPKGFCL